MLGSFKIKLVGYFLALSLLPLAAAFWGFSAVAERERDKRRRRTPAGRAERGARRVRGRARRAPETAASGSASDPAFQRALVRR